MKKKIFLGIIITLLIVAVIVEGVIIFNQSKKDEKKENDTQEIIQETTEPTVEPTKVPSPSVSKGENLTITKKYSSANNKKVYTYMTVDVIDKLNDNESYKYEIPQINIKSNDVDKINKKILQKFEDIIDAMEEEQYIDFSCEALEYEYFENDDILSLVMYMPTESGGVFGCDVYNVNIETGEEVTNDEIISELNIEKEKINSTIKKVMEDKTNKASENANIDIPDEYKARIETAIQLALSTNVNNHKMFINNKGNLCMYIETINLTFAGGDTGTYLFDLENEKEILR